MPQVTSLPLALHHLPFCFHLPCAGPFTSQHFSASTYSAVGSTRAKVLFDYLEHYYINIPLEPCQGDVRNGSAYLG